MSISLDQLLDRLDDPGTPVVWLDPALPGSLWQQLPEAARARGFLVLDLGRAGPIFDAASLLAAFGRLLADSPLYGNSFSSLRSALLEFAMSCPAGALVLFPNPEALRQNDEAAFEELIEALENVDELCRTEGCGGLKAVIRD